MLFLCLLASGLDAWGSDAWFLPPRGNKTPEPKNSSFRVSVSPPPAGSWRTFFWRRWAEGFPGSGSSFIRYGKVWHTPKTSARDGPQIVHKSASCNSSSPGGRGPSRHPAQRVPVNLGEPHPCSSGVAPLVHQAFTLINLSLCKGDLPTLLVSILRGVRTPAPDLYRNGTS